MVLSDHLWCDSLMPVQRMKVGCANFLHYVLKIGYDSNIRRVVTKQSQFGHAHPRVYQSWNADCNLKQYIYCNFWHNFGKVQLSRFWFLRWLVTRGFTSVCVCVGHQGALERKLTSTEHVTCFVAWQAGWLKWSVDNCFVSGWSKVSTEHAVCQEAQR